MNTTRALLARTDAQLRRHPDVWPAFVLTFAAYRTNYVLRCRDYAMLRDADGRLLTFPVCILLAEIEGEPWSHCTAFSLS